MKPHWIPAFREAAKAVKEAIDPLTGTPSAAEPLMIRGDGDVTRRIDAIAEETAIEILQETHESFRLVSEELGIRDFGDGKNGTVVLDPLDGSANAIRGIPAYSFSIAFSSSRRLNDVSEAIVADLVDGDIYEATLHHGASLNEGRIRTSDTQKLSESMISADLNIVDLRIYLKRIIGILNMARRKRYLGTNALEICLVASGKYDAFIDLRGMSRVTDVAASYLVLKEAGGVFVDEDGSEVDVELEPNSRLSFVAVANLDLCRNILMNLRKV
jgi:myo-inositol-1(or 4)-monophosphatase